MRTTAGSALLLVICGVLAAPASGATLAAPGSVAPREVVAVTAKRLPAGSAFAVFLARENATGIHCVAPIATRTPRSGRTTVFSGTVPAKLTCPSPGGTTMAVRPGASGYRFVACVPLGRDCRFMPVAMRDVRIVRAGRACARVPLGRRSASGLRARGVTCSVASEVVRGAIGGARSYRRARFSCRGTVDGPRTVYRCTRGGSRVTFRVA